MSIVFLRGVNVGRGNRMSSADWAQALTEASGVPFESFLASGNFYSHTDVEPAALRAAVAHTLETRDLRVSFSDLENAELDRVLGLVPPGITDKAHFLVFFAPGGFSGERLADLRRHAAADETVDLVGGYLMVNFGSSIHDSALAALIDKILGTRSTGRNLNTLERLQKRLHAGPKTASPPPGP